MADRIDQVAERLNEQIAASKADLALRLGVADTVDGQNADRTLSNTSLLLESLATFYRDPKSEFFPTIITAAIRDRLIQAANTFAGLPAVGTPVPADSASNLLRQLDDLYAYCLQYGLISFGFTGKVAQEQIELIRRTRQQTEAAAKRFLATIDDFKSDLTNKLVAFERPMADAESALKSAVTERLNALQPSIDGLAALLAASQSDSTKIAGLLNVATENAAAAQKVRADLEAAFSQAMTELASRKTAVDTELATIQSRGTQVQGFESDAKAKLQGVTDAQATIKNQLNEITAFYGKIEAYQSLMTETGKTAQSDLATLLESSEQSVEGFRERTEKIVATNESLIDQIKDHLRKAIGASLFTAFDTRRRHIYYASWVWGILLFFSVSGVIWFAISFVTHLAALAKSDVHPALLYARLIIVAPLAFLVAFTSKQFARERRAEEEYAFKSAISVSLDSYRDLISRMKKEGDDATFVERLVLEIFDNPAKRLYARPRTTVEKDELNPLDGLT